MSKKKKMLVALFVLLGVAVLGLAGAVYAKYIASLEKTGTAKIAKWTFTADNQNGDVECSLTSTVVDGAIRDADNGIMIAPGTSGVCEIELKNESDVRVKYTISKSSFENAPTNLKLNGSAAADFAAVSDYIEIDGTKKATITWEWPFQTGDTVTDGAIVDGQKTGDLIDNDDAGKSMTLKFKVQGVQVNPATGL